jgi:hypothetical protein
MATVRQALVKLFFAAESLGMAAKIAALQTGSKLWH